MAQRLARGLTPIRPVEANVVFARFTPAQAAALREQGFLFGHWPIFGDDAYRLVTAFDTTEEQVDGFVGSAQCTVHSAQGQSAQCTVHSAQGQSAQGTVHSAQGDPR